MDDSSTERLKASLRARAEALQPGARLPSTRTLTAVHRVSPVTVSRALADLAAEGVVVSRPGAGTFVAPRRRPVAAPTDHAWQTVALTERTIDTSGLSPLADPPQVDGVISLATGYLHASLMPTSLLNGALARAARRPGSWERPPAAGLHGLRTWFAAATGHTVDAQDVTLTSGGQGAISTAFRALVPPGHPLLVESPTYPGALAAARAAGIRPVPVPTDARGVVPELLAEAFDRTGARAFFCQPTFQNPSGAVLAPERRRAVLECAAAAGAFVIEDDFGRWLSHGGRPPAPLLAEDDDGRVVYITSLTKALSASMRIGALIARGPVAQRLEALRSVDDLFVPRPMQEAALDVLSRPAWERHVRQLGHALGQRTTVLLGALAAEAPLLEPSRPTGGMHVWARLPQAVDDVQAVLAARQANVIVMPGRPFFPAEALHPYLRLTICAAAGPDDLVAGVHRLALAVPALTGSASGRRRPRGRRAGVAGQSARTSSLSPAPRG